MNTYTNSIHPKKEAQRTARNDPFHNPAIIALTLTLVTTVALAIFIANRPVVAAENPKAVPYSNALEMQYARPWLEDQKKPVVTYSNALELQYARPWLEAQKKPVVEYGNAMDMLYAQPWLEAQNKSVIEYSNAMELQYAQPWLDKAELRTAVTDNPQEQIPLSCSSSMELFYACKNGFDLP